MFSLFKGSVSCSINAQTKPILEVPTLLLTWSVFALVLLGTSVPRRGPGGAGDGDDWEGVAFPF